MNRFLKKIFKATGLYHPLQRLYREGLLERRHQRIQKEFEKFKGAGFTCNICGATYKKFAPDHPQPENAEAIERNAVIAGYGENVFCPACMSTARERLVVAMLEKMKLEGLTILHISPERKVYEFIKNRSVVVTADIAPGYYRNIDRSVQFGDLTNLPYENASFDMIIANHVLEHIPDDRTAMLQLFRVLKMGGRAILQVPFSTKLNITIEDAQINEPQQQSAMFGQKDHVRIYALSDYIVRLKGAGFSVNYLPYEALKNFYGNAIQSGEGFFEITK